MEKIMARGGSCGNVAKVYVSGYTYWRAMVLKTDWIWSERERKAIEEAGFRWGKFRSVILDTNLKCLLDIQVDMFPRHIEYGDLFQCQDLQYHLYTAHVLSHVRLCNPKDYSLLGSSVHFSGKITGVGCHFLLQGIFLTQGSNPNLYTGNS